MYAGNRWRFDYRESSIAVTWSGWCMLGTCRDLSVENQVLLLLGLVGVCWEQVEI